MDGVDEDGYISAEDEDFVPELDDDEEFVAPVEIVQEKSDEVAPHVLRRVEEVWQQLESNNELCRLSSLNSTMYHVNKSVAIARKRKQSPEEVCECTIVTWQVVAHSRWPQKFNAQVGREAQNTIQRWLLPVHARCCKVRRLSSSRQSNLQARRCGTQDSPRFALRFSH